MDFEIAKCFAGTHAFAVASMLQVLLLLHYVCFLSLGLGAAAGDGVALCPLSRPQIFSIAICGVKDQTEKQRLPPRKFVSDKKLQI